MRHNRIIGGVYTHQCDEALVALIKRIKRAQFNAKVEVSDANGN